VILPTAGAALDIPARARRAPRGRRRGRGAWRRRWGRAGRLRRARSRWRRPARLRVRQRRRLPPRAGAPRAGGRRAGRARPGLCRAPENLRGRRARRARLRPRAAGSLCRKRSAGASGDPRGPQLLGGAGAARACAGVRGRGVLRRRGLRGRRARVRLRLPLPGLLAQLGLLVGVEAREQVEALAPRRDRAEVLQLVFEHLPDLQRRGLRRRGVEELVELCERDGLKLREVVVLARAREAQRHLAERVDAVRVVQVVAPVYLAPADAVVNHLLLVAQVSEVGAHVRPELAILGARLARAVLRGHYG